MSYVIVSHNHNEEGCFYLAEMGGEERYGSVTEAIRFEYDEVLDFLKTHKGSFSMGFAVVEIMECTWKILEEISEMNISDRCKNELWRNYHNLKYVVR